MDATVQTQVRERFEAATAALRDASGAPAGRAAAVGAFAVLLHAADYYDAAEPAYQHAQALQPSEPKWPYLLAHLHKSRGETTRSLEVFARALELSPNDVATLVWLGRGYLDQGQADKAEPLFERAQAAAPRTLAAFAGLGQSALARRDFARAAAVLEQGLVLDPSAASLHSPLAMAYRGLGETQKAQAHLKQWRNTEILVPDPVRQELDLSLQSGLSFELRGVRALETRDFAAAAAFFTEGVAMTPGTNALGRSLRHKLGTALFLGGDLRGAVQRFEETVRFAPTDGTDESTAKAHYSLGVLMASAGRHAGAIRHLAAAVRQNPNYVEALQALGDQQRRAGQLETSIETYDAVLRISPQAQEARFGHGMALVRLRRFRQARDWFDEGTRLYPDRPDLRHALARVLAAAPDDGVRDGVRAMRLVEELLQTNKSTDVGETMAMAFAEVGDFTQAVAVQRGVHDSASRAGLTAQARATAENLRRYERGQPCRIPWRDSDPAHVPGPPVTPGLGAALGSSGAS
jgi:tetratricopeptide (TPR) repeat protein